MLSENRAAEGLATGLSIADNVTMSRLTDLGPRFLVFPSRQAAAARRWIERFGIRSTRAAAAGQRALGRQPAEGRDRAASAS